MPWTDMPMYMVSNLGRVRSHKYSESYIVPTCYNNHWYEYYQFRLFSKRHSFTIHSMVMLAFKWKRPDWLEVNHIDGNKKNNNLENLEYCTRQENIQHAYKIWLKVALKWDKHHFYGKTWASHPKSHTVLQRDLNGNLIKEWGSSNLAAISLGCSRGTINTAANKNKRAVWFFWEKK